MVRDIELPYTHHINMSRCQLKFLLYLLIKQNGDCKTKWWPENIRFKMPITNSLDMSKDTLIDLFKSYCKYNGDSDWLRAILYFIENLNNLNNETDFSTIDISGKISHNGLEFDIVPEMEPVAKKKFTILNKSTDTIFNISPAVVKHFNNTILEDKTSNLNTLHLTEKMAANDKDMKLCIKESHIKQMMPAVTVQLYDVVKYNEMRSKEDFLLTLNLMKTDVLSKLNLLKFRRRLRNTSRDSIRSTSEYEKDLIKFKSKPSKDIVKEPSKQKEKKKKPRMKVKEKDKPSETSNINTNTECILLPKNDVIVVVDDIDMNKENSFKDNVTTTPKINSIFSPKTLLSFQPTKFKESTDHLIIDLTLEDTPTKAHTVTNNLHQFLNISPKVSPKSDKKMKLSPTKTIQKFKRHSMPLLNQKGIASYFNPVPIKLSPEVIRKKLEKLKNICRPCFVRLDLVKNLKPIRSATEESEDANVNTDIQKIKTLPIPIVIEEVVSSKDINTEIRKIETLPQPIVIEEVVSSKDINTEIRKIKTLPLPIVIEDVVSSIIDLTNDEEMPETQMEDNCNKIVEKCDTIEQNDQKLNDTEIKIKPKNIKIKKNKKTTLKIKWPTKRLTL